MLKATLTDIEVQMLIQNFWKRWEDEYLPAIFRRTRWSDARNPLQKSYVVAVTHAAIPNSWQQGRIAGQRKVNQHPRQDRQPNMQG